MYSGTLILKSSQGVFILVSPTDPTDPTDQSDKPIGQITNSRAISSVKAATL
jgi:hypothetical protein